MQTYLRKYLWPEAVFAISQPGGRGTSSGISYEDWRRCWGEAPAGGMPDMEPPETAPSWREAGDECARTWWGVRVPPLPASVLACEWGVGWQVEKKSCNFLIYVSLNYVIIIHNKTLTTLQSNVYYLQSGLLSPHNYSVSSLPVTHVDQSYSPFLFFPSVSASLTLGRQVIITYKTDIIYNNRCYERRDNL